MSNKLFKQIGLLLLLSSTPAFGQFINVGTEDDLVYEMPVEDEGTTLFNTPSARHTHIENFDYAIALPNTGYVQSSSNFSTSFENEVDNANIVIGQYVQDIASLLRNSDKNCDLYEINGVKAKLYKEADDKGRYKQTLRLETNVPLVVTATCNATDTININKLERSILSIVYTGPAQKDKNVYSTSLFSISNGNYKLENSGLQWSIFTRSGDVSSERAKDHKDFFQLATIKSNVKKKQQKEAKKLVEGLMWKGCKIAKNQKTVINGRNAYEFDLLTTDDEGKVTEKSYATVIYTSDRLYLFFASANENMDENIKNFKKIAQTLKIK